MDNEQLWFMILQKWGEKLASNSTSYIIFLILKCMDKLGLWTYHGQANFQVYGVHKHILSSKYFISSFWLN